MSKSRAQEALDAGQAAATKWLQENIDAGGVCDFCSHPFTGHESTWITDHEVSASFTITDHDGQEATTVNDYGLAWAACAKCDPIIASKDPAGLAAFVMSQRLPREPPNTLTREQLLELRLEAEKDLVILYSALYANGLHRVQGVASRRRPPTTGQQAFERCRVVLARAAALNNARGAAGTTDLEKYKSRRLVVSLYIEAEQIDRAFKLGVFSDENRATLAALEAANRRASEDVASDARAERLAERAARRPADVVQEGTKCSSCKKRPARVNDLCKRCARETGLLAKGKSI